MSSLRDILRTVPQDPEFHPEGNVWIHSRAVRASIDEAISIMKAGALPSGIRHEKASVDPRERNVLRLAGWCHDLGKASATREVRGRWNAAGHEKAEHFNRVCRRLGPLWKKMWARSAFEDKKTFVYLVTRHMSVCDHCGVDPRIARSLEGKHPSRRRRGFLVILFMMMDRLGCASPSRIEDAKLVIGALEKTVLPASVRPRSCGRKHGWRAM